MKIALLGYGKMGKMIEQIATSRKHTIIAKIDDTFDIETIKDADVAIDFSVPTSAFNNITSCFKAGIPVISGTTGWLDKYDEAVTICNKHKGAFIYASNFSLGVNIFFQLNEYLAKMMNALEQYNVSMEEIHHTQKLDAPSGTAITLAEGIIRNSSKTAWKLDEAKENEIPIIAKRIGKTPGTHSITYSSDVDDISIKHTAHGREGFALGAVIAAEWIQHKTGIFNMKDVLNLPK